MKNWFRPKEPEPKERPSFNKDNKVYMEVSSNVDDLRSDTNMENRIIARLHQTMVDLGATNSSYTIETFVGRGALFSIRILVHEMKAVPPR